MQQNKNLPQTVVDTMSRKRLQNEEKQIKEKFKNGQMPDNIELSPVIEEGTKNLFKWNLVIKGRPGTLWEGGVYRFLIDYNGSIFNPPIVTAENKEFKHIHLYEDQKICLGMITEGIWNMETPLFMIAIEIEDLIHREPNTTSPANYVLCEKFMKSPQEYEKYIKEIARNCV